MTTSDKLTFRLGYFMPVGGRLFGICSVLFGLVFISGIDRSLLYFFISIPLFIIGVACFATRQLIIDKHNMSMTEVTNCVGYKSKTRVDLSKYFYVSIISQLYKETSSSRIRGDSVNQYKLFDVVLLSKNHYGKYKVISTADINDAKSEAAKLSTYLGFDVVKFAPVRTRQKNNYA